MSFLTAFEWAIVTHFAVAVLVLVFSQKIKDFFTGVPTDLRSGLKTVEGSILADVKNYQAGLIAKITPAPAPVLKAPEPAAPAAPAPAAPAA